MLDLMVNNSAKCPAQDLECMGSSQVQAKMGFLVVERMVNKLETVHLHH